MLDLCVLQVHEEDYRAPAERYLDQFLIHELWTVDVSDFQGQLGVDETVEKFGVSILDVIPSIACLEKRAVLSQAELLALLYVRYDEAGSLVVGAEGVNKILAD